MGGLGLLGCHGGAHWQAPANIDNTGATDVSEALTNWLASTGVPGDAFELRRRPDGSPGRYWVPRGVRIGKPMLFDMMGCQLFTGLTLGFDDPNIEASKAAHPPLWDDWGERTDAGAWPARRVVVLVASSNVVVASSQEGARIQGAARTVHYRGSETLVGRRAPTGCQFHGAAFGDGQHGIRIGGRPGSYSNTNFFDGITLDLTNISVEFNHGDGVYLNDNHRHVTIKGRNLGEPTLGGRPHPVDDGVLEGYTLQGGTIVQGATRADDRWVPGTWLPGIHHTGRQGIATDFRNYDTLIENVAIWRTGRGTIDWEPAANFAEILRPTIRGIEVGIHTLLFMPCAGPRPIRDLVCENVVLYEQPTIDTFQAGATHRHSNWRIENVRCTSGVKMRSATVFRLGRIDGLQVLDNHALIKGTGDGINTAGNGTTGPNGASTGVVIDPAESVQFPFSP